MDKNEQCRILSRLRDKLKYECNEAEQKYRENLAEIKLIDALLKQISDNLTSSYEPVKSGVSKYSTDRNTIVKSIGSTTEHLRQEQKLRTASESHYAGMDKVDREKYEEFMQKYKEGKFLEASYIILGINQNLSSFTRDKWEMYEGKDEISLSPNPNGKYCAYPMDENRRRFFLVPSKKVKFSYLQCIIYGFPAFFDFDMDKAMGSEPRTPIVILPAIVEKDAEGNYFRAGQGGEYPPKGKLEL